MSDSDSNRRTREAYEKSIAAYVDETPQVVAGDYKTYIDRVLAYAKTGGVILELGSGFGRDANYFEEHGYVIDRTDAVSGFVNYMKSEGHKARLLNALTDTFGGPYDMIYANAVLVHFTPEESKEVLSKALSALNPGGIIALSVRQGEDSEWETEKLGEARFFQNWMPDRLTKVIESAGFEVLHVETKPSVRPGIVWLRIISRNPLKSQSIDKQLK